jgi:hypothetical protein
MVLAHPNPTTTATHRAAGSPAPSPGALATLAMVASRAALRWRGVAAVYGFADERSRGGGIELLASLDGFGFGGELVVFDGVVDEVHGAYGDRATSR